MSLVSSYSGLLFIPKALQYVLVFVGLVSPHCSLQRLIFFLINLPVHFSMKNSISLF